MDNVSLLILCYIVGIIFGIIIYTIIMAIITYLVDRKKPDIMDTQIGVDSLVNDQSLFTNGVKFSMNLCIYKVKELKTVDKHEEYNKCIDDVLALLNNIKNE